MNKLFVDTSGWIALTNRTDSLHELAARTYEERLEAGWHFVTHAGVMLEVGNGFALTRFRHLAARLKTIIDTSALIEVVHLTEKLYEAGWLMYTSRSDKEWGIVDCISFVIMQEQNLNEALTADRDFEQAGFIRLLVES